MAQRGTLKYLVDKLQQSVDKADITTDHLWYAIRGAINPELLISNLAEALRISASETEHLLAENGFGDIVAQHKLVAVDDSEAGGPKTGYCIHPKKEPESPFPDIFSIEFSPGLSKPVQLNHSEHEAVSLLVKTITQSADNDAFIGLYRKGVKEYHDRFMASDAKAIQTYVEKHFAGGRPRYIVNSGIGANEQFNHFLAHINNANPNRQSTWLIIDSPKRLVKLPADATLKNTLFMEFSRSGKTEEPVKIHEYTPREAKRIVFANSGPLREIGIRDDNLVLDFPDQVSGRYGRNKTPILLAPMFVAGMDTKEFWQTIEKAIVGFDLSSPFSLPAQIAQFIYIHQQQNRINHIYLGCDHDVLAYSANEWLQFWNEGVNKDGNDISMSRYFGLLRDSHANIEGLLANHKTKMGIFLLSDHMRPDQLPPMTLVDIDPINKEHAGLQYGDEEFLMAEANYERFSEIMPAIRILVHGNPALDHAAVLGQLWSDITYFYSRMMYVDPGSNPEVKHVRDRAAKLLAESALKKREKRE